MVPGCTIVIKQLKMQEMSDQIRNLFIRYSGHEPESIFPLTGAGSDRRYYRITSGGESYIGAFNPDRADNHAFNYLTRHFTVCGLPVPEMLATDEEQGICLMQDLGNEDLLCRIQKFRDLPDCRDLLYTLYCEVLDYLLEFQLTADKNLDYTQLPVQAFDAESMHWDLNYFKYYFLKPSGISFNEKQLQQDFNKLVKFLTAEKLHGFMYRDFQARNIMIKNRKLFFIDYQGGRKGPLQYDVVSLIFQVKASIPGDLKEKLIKYYLQRLKQRVEINTADFMKHMDGFALLRFLQVLGAYGFRGWFERKSHFLESIQLLGPNLKWITVNMPLELPEISKIINEIKRKMEDQTLVQKKKLTVTINSFSYRRGIPYDPTGHGGGFVFDCRLLPNPGLLEIYRDMTGTDEPVIKFLESEPSVNKFVETIRQLVGQSVENYIATGYEHLQLNFGCTGGRHRSVYCAGQIAQFLQSDPSLEVVLKHKELPNI